MKIPPKEAAKYGIQIRKPMEFDDFMHQVQKNCTEKGKIAGKKELQKELKSLLGVSDDNLLSWLK